MKTWHYSFPNDKPGEGWAHITLSENGMFAAVSDFGNYAFLWSHTGKEDIREFFLDAKREWQYFAGKLKPEKVLNEAESWKRIKTELLERRRAGDVTREEAREAWDEMELYSSSWNEYLDSSSCNKVFDEAWDFSVYELQADVVAFCTRVLPRLADTLRAELEGRPHLGSIIKVELGRHKNFCITKKHFEALRTDLYRRAPPRSIFQDWVKDSCDVRGDKLYPHHFLWSGTQRNIETLAETLKGFEGQAEIIVFWGNGEVTGYALDNHRVTQHSVKFSLVK